MQLFRRRKNEVNSTVIGWGSLGKGMKVAHCAGSRFLKNLKSTGFDMAPVTFVSPDTVARCKNALTLHEFKSCSEEYLKLLAQFVPGSIYTVSAVGVGGGTGNHGIEIVEQLKGKAEYLALRMYFSQEIFQQGIGYSEIARRYINSNVQLSLAGDKLKNGMCSLEILSMSDMLRQFGRSYNQVDLSAQELMNVIVACSVHPGNGFDLEDVLSNPEFRVRTYGFQEIGILGRYEAMITRIFAALQDLKPLIGSNYFTGEIKQKVMGAPLVIVAGPSDLVMNIQQGFVHLGGSINSLEDVENMLEVSSSNPGDAMIIPFPVELDSVYLAAIYPVDEKWFAQQCATAKKKVLDLYEKARKSTSDTLLIRVFRSMLNQAGNPKLNDFLE
jgi:hypothetical protein